jgi:hypothetical protein
MDDCGGIEAVIDNTGTLSRDAATVVSGIVADDKVGDGDAAEEGNGAEDGDGSFERPRRRSLELAWNKYISRIFELNQPSSSSKITQSLSTMVQ